MKRSAYTRPLRYMTLAPPNPHLHFYIIIISERPKWPSVSVAFPRKAKTLSTVRGRLVGRSRLKPGAYKVANHDRFLYKLSALQYLKGRKNDVSSYH